jgi:hypothetical protein
MFNGWDKNRRSRHFAGLAGRRERGKRRRKKKKIEYYRCVWEKSLITLILYTTPVRLPGLHTYYARTFPIIAWKKYKQEIKIHACYFLLDGVKENEQRESEWEREREIKQEHSKKRAERTERYKYYIMYTSWIL